MTWSSAEDVRLEDEAVVLRSERLESVAAPREELDAHAGGDEAVDDRSAEHARSSCDHGHAIHRA